MDFRPCAVEGMVTPMENLNSAHDVVSRDLAYIRTGAEAAFDKLAGKAVLVTGGAGFLGYYLVQAILSRNGDVPADRRIRLTVYDNYIRGVPQWLKALSGNPDLTLVRHDITGPLPDAMPDFQYIIHAASIASPIYYRKHPIETMDANVNGLRRLLEYCRRQPAEKAVEGFLFFSSSEIYGDPPPHRIPTDETYPGEVSCTGPRACYDESKRFGETLSVNFARQYGLPIKIVRPFNNYGPGLKITDRRVLPDFARNILNGEDIVLLSDGSPTRTFCYVADAVMGYFRVLVHGRPGEAYNIGVSTPEISMRELAEKVVGLGRDLFGYAGRVVRRQSGDESYLTDNPNRRCPIIEKARAEVGYSPGIELEEGLRRMLIWYGDNRNGEDA